MRGDGGWVELRRPVDPADQVADEQIAVRTELERVAGSAVAGDVSMGPGQVADKCACALVVDDLLIGGEQDMDRDGGGFAEAGDDAIHAARCQVETRGGLVQLQGILLKKLDPLGVGGEESGVVQRDVELSLGRRDHGQADLEFFGGADIDDGEDPRGDKDQTGGEAGVGGVGGGYEFSAPTDADEVNAGQAGQFAELVGVADGVCDELIGGLGVTTIGAVASRSAAVGLQHGDTGIAQGAGGVGVPSAMGLNPVNVKGGRRGIGDRPIAGIGRVTVAKPDVNFLKLTHRRAVYARMRLDARGLG